jgi:7,8-dihydro-6-hydroxymethylpterin-pyrophosphokinase
MGRQKVIDKGPRNIDLDILLYEDEVVKHPRLNIPHIGIPEREFVLRPLAEFVVSRFEIFLLTLADSFQINLCIIQSHGKSPKTI